MRKQLLAFGVGALVAFLSAPVFAQSVKKAPANAAAKTPAAQTMKISAEGQLCLGCHASTTPVIVQQWKQSAHFRQGVDCFGCHKARPDDPAAADHYGQKIAIVVTPNYCSGCHAKEVDQYEHSRHARAAQFIGSLDNFLGEVVEGAPIVQSACRQCHGSNVAYLGDGKFSAASWPNSAVGRVNPDGSLGSCSACHGRHSFSVAQAREPETCGKCHMGPDHPQIEIYSESMHGILFRANHDKMNLTGKQWIAGKDYTAAPACVTCHMNGTPDRPETTHDVGTRLSWTLRPAVSVHVADWEKNRASMQEVCQSCHADGLVKNFYKQYDDAVNFYNSKYGGPSAALMKKLAEKGVLTKTPFDAQIKWDYYEMWHHEGRAARMGAAMNGPDYTQWHGFYEVAKDFYRKLLPEAEKLSPGITGELMQAPENSWTKGLSKEEIQQQIDYYKRRYNQ